MTNFKATWISACILAVWAWLSSSRSRCQPSVHWSLPDHCHYWLCTDGASTGSATTGHPLLSRHSRKFDEKYFLFSSDTRKYFPVDLCWATRELWLISHGTPWHWWVLAVLWYCPLPMYLCLSVSWSLTWSLSQSLITLHLGLLSVCVCWLEADLSVWLVRLHWQ